MAQTFFDPQGNPLSLLLYQYETCPFCQRVFVAADALGLSLPMRDIRKDKAALAELVNVGGSRQVPCLFVNGKPLYESADIIEFLKTQVRIHS
ncbi:MAG TPA: glutathione S-transferase N-terminal domain-containing protein [Pseudomonadota bacterium]|jgi:glutaredoxin|nr:glutathione S-transferase N-terminal domain-containing protein [Pseudomonadota bacterium]